MSAKKTWVLTALALALPCLAGCLGGSDGASRSASRARATRGQKDTAAKSGKSAPPRRNQKPEDLDNLSPEASMQRDLARLKEKERQQVKTVSEMRTALGQGQEIVMKEEKNLEELRGQISKYESAMRQYENVASAADTGRSADPRRGSPAMASRYDSRQTRTSGPADGEVMLYDGRAEAPVAAATPPRRDAPSRQPEYARAEPPRQAPPAQSGPARQDGWAPPTNLFDTRPSVSPLAAAQTARREEQFSAMMPPARQPARQPVRPAASPAAPAPAPQPAQTFAAPAPVPAAGATFDDEVFTPDLFLSSGK